MCDYMFVVARTNYFQIHVNNLTLDICLLSKRGITLVPLHLPGHFLNILIFSPLAPNISNHNTRGGTLLIVSHLQLIVLSHSILSHSKKSDGNIFIILKHGGHCVCVIPITQYLFLSQWPPKLYNFTPTIHLPRWWGILGTPSLFNTGSPPPPWTTTPIPGVTMSQRHKVLWSRCVID